MYLIHERYNERELVTEYLPDENNNWKDVPILISSLENIDEKLKEVYPRAKKTTVEGLRITVDNEIYIKSQDEYKIISFVNYLLPVKVI